MTRHCGAVTTRWVKPENLRLWLLEKLNICPILATRAQPTLQMHLASLEQMQNKSIVYSVAKGQRLVLKDQCFIISAQRQLLLWQACCFNSF